MNAASRIAEAFMGERSIPVPAKPEQDETKTMKALVWNAKNDVQYISVPAPLLTDEKDVIIRIRATTICGSDIHLVDGSVPTMHPGDVLGHEFLGVVEQVGAQVRDIKKGDRVIVAFDIACGTCNFCKREEYSGCKMTNPNNLQASMFGHNTGAIFGYSHLTGGVPGGQAELVRVPYADTNCLVIPEGVTDEKALMLTDVVPTAYHAAKLGDVGDGDNVAIWGMGPVGLFAARWCKLMGANRVIGIDCVPYRLQKARDWGIDTIDFNENPDVVGKLHSMFPEGIDVAIECAGGEYSKSLTDKFERAMNLETDSADIFKEMFQSVRPFGRVSVIGIYIGYANHFPVGAMMEKGLTIRGGQCPVQKYWKKIMAMVVDGQIDPSCLITHHGKLSDGPTFYKKFMEREDNILKVLLRPDGEVNIE